MKVTVRDIAKAAGTSAATVSAALHGTRGTTIRVAPATRERIIQLASEMGYVSPQTRHALHPGRTQILGLMLPYVEALVDRNPFCSQVTSAVFSEVIRQNYNLMLFTRHASINGSEVPVVATSHIDGAILVLPAGDSSALFKFEKRNIPYVSVIREPIVGSFSVNANDFEGGRMATDHLIRLGHRRIAHLYGEESIYTTQGRLAGYSEALIQAGLHVDQNLILKGGFDWKLGYNAAKRLLALPPSSRPTAIFAANDLSAEGVLRACREMGVSVPGDLAIVGFDDTWFATNTEPQLTSVRMPIEDMCALAVQMLIERIEGGTISQPQPILPVTLSVRASCGASRC